LARKHRVIVIDETDRGIVDFLRTAASLGVDGYGKRVNDKAEQDKVVKETAELFRSKPKNVAKFSHVASASGFLFP
jgi:hypothetical protein